MLLFMYLELNILTEIVRIFKELKALPFWIRKQWHLFVNCLHLPWSQNPQSSFLLFSHSMSVEEGLCSLKHPMYINPNIGVTLISWVVFMLDMLWKLRKHFLISLFKGKKLLLQHDWVIQAYRSLFLFNFVLCQSIFIDHINVLFSNMGKLYINSYDKYPYMHTSFSHVNTLYSLFTMIKA